MFEGKQRQTHPKHERRERKKEMLVHDTSCPMGQRGELRAFRGTVHFQPQKYRKIGTRATAGQELNASNKPGSSISRCRGDARRFQRVCGDSLEQVNIFPCGIFKREACDLPSIDGGLLGSRGFIIPEVENKPRQASHIEWLELRAILGRVPQTAGSWKRLREFPLPQPPR